MAAIAVNMPRRKLSKLITRSCLDLADRHLLEKQGLCQIIYDMISARFPKKPRQIAAAAMPDRPTRAKRLGK
jgi:hypothetical protein